MICVIFFINNVFVLYIQAAAAGGGAAFGQSGQLGNSPSTVLISSTSNSLMSATVKPSTQQIGAIGAYNMYHLPKK